MTQSLPHDTELYRQQLEARARIFYSTSDIWLRVSAQGEEDWVADLHHRRAGAAGNEEDAQLEPYPEHPGGFGSTAQAALEDFAVELDVREKALEQEAEA